MFASGSASSSNASSSFAENDTSATYGASSNQPLSSAGGSEFFKTYYSSERFICGTSLSALAAASNGFMLVWVAAVRRKRSPSTWNNRLMFLHMVAANIACCATLWLSDNLLILFSRQMAELFLRNVCHFLVYPTSAIFAASSFGLVSKLSMLGFCSVQYISVCHPLRHSMDQVRRKSVLFLVLTWCFSLLVGLLPFLALKILTAINSGCESWIRQAVLKVLSIGIAIGAIFDAIIYAAIVLICLGIYHRMRVVRREIARFRFSSDARCEMKTIASVTAIMAVLNLYSVSHLLIHVSSLNGFGGLSLDNRVLIYYMNMSSYVKLMLEPVIYGLRMHEVHELVKHSKIQLDRYLTGCCSKSCKTSRDSLLVMTSFNTISPPAQV